MRIMPTVRTNLKNWRRREAAKVTAEAERDKALQRADVLEQALLVLRDRPLPEQHPAQSGKKSDSAPRPAAASPRTTAAEPKAEDEKLRALRMATDNPLVINRGSARTQQADAQSKPTENTAKIERKDKRTPSKVRATFEKEGTGHARFCMILDKSSSGAKLEIVRGKLGSAVDDLAVGDRLTLVFTIGQERTSVACEVKWVDGSHCGVMYRGQFRTEINKPPKTSKEGPGSAKGSGGAAKAKKSSKWFARA